MGQPCYGTGMGQPSYAIDIEILKKIQRRLTSGEKSVFQLLLQSRRLKPRALLESFLFNFFVSFEASRTSICSSGCLGNSEKSTSATQSCKLGFYSPKKVRVTK